MSILLAMEGAISQGILWGLMTLGVYTPIINILKEIMSFENLSHNLLLIIPIALGLVIGFIVISILMKYLLKKHTTSTYFAILGFIIGSIVTIGTST